MSGWGFQKPADLLSYDTAQIAVCSESDALGCGMEITSHHSSKS